MFFVYVLQSEKDGKCYIGHTNDLVRRLADHNRGKSQSVRGRGPFKLIYGESYINRLEASEREKQLKKYKGGNAFKKLIQQNISDPIV